MARGVRQHSRHERGHGHGRYGTNHGRGGGDRTAGPRKPASEQKGKVVSIKNRIRAVERLLRKPDLPEQVKATQGKRLEELKQLAEEHAKAELERAMALRYRKVKFFERRKVERRIRRVEHQQRAISESNNVNADPGGRQAGELSRQLAQLKEDLNYIRFFPKTEKYISLFVEDTDGTVTKKREELRERIRADLAAAAAAGHDLEETGSEDEGVVGTSEDDFFIAGSSSEDADADDECTDDTSREQQAPQSPGGPPAVSSPPSPAPPLWQLRQPVGRPTRMHGGKHTFVDRPPHLLASGSAPPQFRRGERNGEAARGGRGRPWPESDRGGSMTRQEKQGAAGDLMPPPRAPGLAGRSHTAPVPMPVGYTGVRAGGGAGPGGNRGQGGEGDGGALSDQTESKSKRKRTRPKKKRKAESS